MMDSTYVLVILLGVTLLLIPQTAWMGVAVLVVGIVVYSISARPSAKQFTYIPSPRNRRRALQVSGFDWSMKDISGRGQDAFSTAQEPLGGSNQGSYIRDGMFNFPLPIDNEVAQFVDLRYKTPTSAKTFTEGRDKRGNPWLPGF